MSSSELHVIQENVRSRVEEIEALNGNWPCRKGCDDCCKQLAAVPTVTEPEWRAIADAIQNLPEQTANVIRQRIRDSTHLYRPIVCPMLDTSSGACLIYDARPVACRSYGFYVERADVLGCSRIEAIADSNAPVVWGNHVALNERLSAMGSASELHVWLASECAPLERT
jgi:Fe-S-cluster containining protein